MILLWIDDMRNPYEGWAERYAPFPPDEVFWAKSYDDVLAFLKNVAAPTRYALIMILERWATTNEMV